ncbi:DUF1616 domain-containing protein [Halorubrum sp. AD140]|uniref:DUF1616 domain-containing protein n=1 Tax=Halorubrum sp. AD140 TaxID=3050073 RepID=UPI002ACCB978|nr:DUF1616 domain-containing protein [Halorubrum sp. AD140]MDZ5810240.1 DUF1616 domain-containing protein [Halorubrum sp. AD140]
MRRETRPASAGQEGLPLDLLAVALVLLVTFASLSLDGGRSVRVIPGAITLLFLPGYVTTAALFPRRTPESPGRTRRPGSMSGHAGGPGSASGRTTAHGALGLRERAVLSVGLSVAVLPILALAIGQFTEGFSELVAFGTVAGYVVLVGIAAWGRRVAVPPTERLSLPIRAWRTEVRDGFATGPTTDRVLTVALVASVLLAGGVFGFAAVNPADGETYTDFHLLTTDESGEYVSAGYPDQLERGETASLTWGLENREAEDTEYTVVVTLERVSQSGDDLRRIETTELDRETTTVAAGETEHRTHEVRPTMMGEDLRLSYYLFKGDAPDRATEEEAYRHLYIWVDVGPFS